MEAVVVALALAVALVVVGRLARARGRELARVRQLLDLAPADDLASRVRDLLEAAEPGRIERIAADMAALADSLPVGVIRLDEARRVVFANRSAHEILGLSAGRLVGRTAMEAFVEPRIEDVLAGRTSAPLELTIRDGEPRTVLLTARPSTVRGFWLVLEDVTRLRRLEQIRREFVDNLSHELRTPLTTIGLLAETAVREIEATAAAGGPTGGRLRERIAKIEEETGHLNQMVAEMLDLARIESGGAVVRTDRVDLARVAAEAVERLRPFAERSGVRLSVTAATELPPVLGDAGRLGQVLVNLLHNAVKFSPDGGPVEVRLERAPDGVLVAVRDEGIGIPRESQARIFERFYKVDRARGRVRGGGTGLGLAIARHIVEAHGGRIWVESEEGRGSTFFVRLPAAETAGPPPGTGTGE
ncbi:MAG TPA: ATP-binding protein [Candidatus Binatia bacterium]|nr:ATP-binding protein [Candidatus Binatia bacterium]